MRLAARCGRWEMLPESQAVVLVDAGYNVQELGEAAGIGLREAQALHNRCIRQLDREAREAKRRADWDKATRRRMVLRELQADVAGLRNSARCM
jgi:lysylphosphatidylglycerol synthetase-like protein (DUF2156 family)